MDRKMSTNEVEAMAKHLMHRHLDMKGKHSHWRFVYDPSPKALAVCHYNIGAITMHPSVVAKGDRIEIMSILLHEIAHALTGHENQEHGPLWHAQLIELIRAHAFGQ